MGKNLVFGFFDGVHLGHQAVIKSAVNCGNAVLITLENSPARFFKKDSKYIIPREESVKKVKSLGVKEIVLEDFEKIHTLTPEEYLTDIVNKYEPETISTGFNYTFGINKSGNADFLKNNQKKYGYKYFCIEPYTLDEEIVSSTLIKRYLQEGNINRANKLLGNPFFIRGKVILGKQIGRKIGFPTANIEYPAGIVEIPYGAYAVKCDNLLGIMNYGIKPTIDGERSPIAEIHILDFSGDLYGKTIKIEIIDKIRNEQKFNNLEELKKQIQKDKETCLMLLS